MENLTKSLATEWAADKIRINAVAPVSAKQMLHCSYTCMAVGVRYTSRMFMWPSQGFIQDFEFEGRNSKVWR